MSSTSLLEPPLLLPFFMPRLNGTNSQMKVIASVSNVSLLGCDVVNIYLGTLRVSPPSLMRRIENSSGPYLTTLQPSYSRPIRHYFIDHPESGHTLRTRAHNFVLHIKDDKNFVSRSTYATLKTHRSDLL